MPRIYLPPDATLTLIEPRVHVAEGRLVHGTPEHPLGPWACVGFPIAGDVHTPVKWDPEASRLWYDPDWKALHLLASGVNTGVLRGVEPCIANGLPLSTRLDAPEYGGGATLLALILQHATWTERWLIGWLLDRPDEPIVQDDLPTPCRPHKPKTAPMGYLCQALERGWMRVAELLWDHKNVRFTPAEAAAGLPIALLAEQHWSSGLSPDATTLWRQRALDAWTPPPVGAVLDDDCTRFLDGLMAGCIRFIPVLVHRRPTEADFTTDAWTARASSWVADFQAIGMSSMAVSSWAKVWLKKLGHPPDPSPEENGSTAAAHRCVRVGLETIALSGALACGAPFRKTHRM